MGQLLDGTWTPSDLATVDSSGRFVRRDAQFRSFIRADGSTPYAPEAGRYHLYVSLACPWACRTLIFRKLKKLEAVIGVSIVHPDMEDDGWHFGDYPGVIADSVHGVAFVHELYTLARPDYSGRVTVPILWDKKKRTIVSNESSEIIRMFNSEFGELGDNTLDFYPAPLRGAIDAINERVYETVNNGVYRTGFASTQAAYEEAFDQLFATLDMLEDRLSSQRYLVGNQITEADWRLLTTLLRFDPVYVTHFKCNLRRLVDTPNLWAYTRELYQIPGVAETVSFDHIKRHYFYSHRSLNPKGIVPRGPAIDFDEPHDRGRFPGDPAFG